jgi:hypothetical protein
MDPQVDNVLNKEEALYVFDEAYQEKLLSERPWQKEYAN